MENLRTEMHMVPQPTGCEQDAHKVWHKQQIGACKLEVECTYLCLEQRHKRIRVLFDGFV